MQHIVPPDKVTVSYEKYGSGPPLVLVHRSFSDHLTNWQFVKPLFEAGLAGLSRRFYARARKIVDIPWAIATGEDLRFPQVTGRRPRGFWIVNRYFERVHAVASKDPVVCRRFFDVLNLLAPPSSLMSPRIAWRVLAPSGSRGEGSPWKPLRPGPASSDPGHQ